MRLTEREKRLVAYPPNVSAWYCGHCHAINAGSRSACFACLSAKPRDPERPYDDYVEALRKVGKGADPSTKHDQEAKDVAQRLPQRASRARHGRGVRRRAR